MAKAKNKEEQPRIDIAVILEMDEIHFLTLLGMLTNGLLKISESLTDIVAQSKSACHATEHLVKIGETIMRTGEIAHAMPPCEMLDTYTRVERKVMERVCD